MRTWILTVAALMWAAMPSKANISFSDVILELRGPGFTESVEGQTSLDDPGSTNGTWSFTADLTTSLTPVAGGNFRSPDIFTATLGDLTLTCESVSGCGATQIFFSVDVTPLNGGAHKLPWEVDLNGTVAGLNATFSDTLTANPLTFSGNNHPRSFSVMGNGTRVFFGDVNFNGTINVPGGIDGATLTLPFGVDFGVPEPATLGLMGMALASLGLMGLRRRTKP